MPDQPTSESPAIIEPQTPVLASPLPIIPRKRRHGRIARLPKAVRDQLNTLIQDGVPYLDLLSRLGPDGAGITEDDLSRWRTDGGFAEWVMEQQKRDLLREKRDRAFDVLMQKNGVQIPQTILQLLATHVCEFVVDLDPANLRETLLSDSDKFSRFVGTMVKLAEGQIKCEQHQHALDDRATAAAKKRAPAERPGISDESLRSAEEKLRLL